MSNYSHIVQIGHLTRDPEITYTPANLSITKFTVATNNGYGAKKDVCFIDVVLFGKTADTAAQHLTKGTAVLIDGRLKQETWEEEVTGKKRSKHYIVGNSWHFVGGKKEDGGREPGQDEEDLPF